MRNYLLQALVHSICNEMSRKDSEKVVGELHGGGGDDTSEELWYNLTQCNRHLNELPVLHGGSTAKGKK